MKTLRLNLTRLLALAVVAAAFPILALVATAATINVDLFERSPNNLQGAPSELSGVVTLSQPVAPGYEVIMETGDPTSSTDQNNRANWGDVIVFGVGNLTTSQVQLISNGSAFPSVDAVTSATHAYMLETQQGTGFDDADITTYAPNGIDGTFTYLVHSDATNCDGIIGTPDPAVTGAATPSAVPSPCPTPSPSPSPTASASASASPAAGAAPAATPPTLPQAGIRPGAALGPVTNPLRVPTLVVALIVSLLVMTIGGYRYRVRG